MVVKIKHRTTDPACQQFKGYPTTPLAKLRFDRGRGKACVHCMHLRSIVAAATAKYQQEVLGPWQGDGHGVGLWTCRAGGCGWTNTSSDAACQRCGRKL